MATLPNTPTEEAAHRLRERVSALRSGDFDGTAAILGDPLWDVLEGKINPKAHPCQIAARLPYPTEWFVDEAAAKLLRQKS